MMQHDYAGWKDKKGWGNPSYFLERITELKAKDQLTKEVFLHIVKDYLLDFNDHHIFFNDLTLQNEEKKYHGFRVRRFEERLYVTNVDAESRLKAGISFKSLGGYTIPELKEKHSRLLNENHAERENWTQILSFYDYGELEDSQGNLNTIMFNFYEKPLYKPTYSIKEIAEKTLLITMTDFANPDAIVNIMAENQELLDSAEQWIIDVRVNYGGSDSSFHPLLPYLMPEDGVELVDKEDRMFFNCTTSNAERALEALVNDLKSTEDEQARLFLNVFKREWERNKGRGFVEFNFEDIMPETFIKGKGSPKSIVVLTDFMCGSSGDSFVEACKKSSKVTVIGRATMGLNDYANLLTKKWEEGFELMYPSSRLSRIDKGEGMTGKGILPHIYIPWTPKHIEVDVDMERALDVLSLSNVSI